MSLNEEVYDVLHENLVAVRSAYNGRPVVLCPICLREIHRDDVIRWGVEHIIPKNVISGDHPRVAQHGTKNQRCGITFLCRNPRACRSNAKMAHDGCNGLKGQLYDRLFRGLFDESYHSPYELTPRHGAAILIMAYLVAFQYFGYEYILRPELDTIREQFDYPDERKTEWLDMAKYDTSGKSQFVVTSSGQPFVWGGVANSNANLHVFFRRCQASLPPGFWKLNHVTRHLETLFPRLRIAIAHRISNATAIGPGMAHFADCHA